MMRRLCTAVLAIVLSTVPARAVMFAHDVAIASTLLLPYFEVDLDEPPASTTTIRFGTVVFPTLAHVTLWTDLGVPTFSFDVYLDAYDVVELDLRLVLSGILPQTGPTITNLGTHSVFGSFAFPNCETLLTQPRLSTETVTSLRNAHTGAASALWGEMCGARPVGDNVARGYVTIDAARRCSTDFPSDPNYFTNIAVVQNTLWGEFVIREDPENFAYGGTLVHIEANNGAFPGNRTFYGRLVNGSTDDEREPIPSFYLGRYLNGGLFTGGTHLLVWRDPGVRTPFACGGALPRLQQREVTPFDEAEEAVDLTQGLPVGFQTRMPWAAERIDTSDTNRLPIPYNFGFLLMDLDFPPSVVDPLFSGVNQAAVVLVHRASGRFAGALPAWPVVDQFNPHPVN